MEQLPLIPGEICPYQALKLATVGGTDWEAGKEVKKLTLMGRKAEMPLPQLLTSL